MKWPYNKDFAFTIIDDTDKATIQNITPVYDYLASKNLITTKTVWVYPSRDKYTGQTIQDEDYLSYHLKLERQGFEIQLHNVGSGIFKRDEIINGFTLFKEKLGRYPSMQINHASNRDNIYWGYKRHGIILRSLRKLFKGKTIRFFGDEIESDCFWGDLSKTHLRFIRNRVFNGINTLKYDPRMPFAEKKNKPYSNYWFSASDGGTVKEFNHLITKSNVDKLIQQKGLCIVYTHFAYGFVDTRGELNKTFKENIDYLSKQNGWFVPATEILEYLLSQKGKKSVGSIYINMLDIKWIIHKIIKKLQYAR
jgi:hypothetical protein